MSKTGKITKASKQKVLKDVPKKILDLKTDEQQPSTSHIAAIPTTSAEQPKVEIKSVKPKNAEHLSRLAAFKQHIIEKNVKFPYEELVSHEDAYETPKGLPVHHIHRLDRRPIADSAQSRSLFATNWRISLSRDPIFPALPTSFTTTDELLDYKYAGELEVDRLNSFFKYVRYSDEQIEQQVKLHQEIHDDLAEADRLIDELLEKEPGLKEAAELVDRIEWLDLPDEARKILNNDPVAQTYKIQTMKASEAQKMLGHHRVDPLDDEDTYPIPGTSIFSEFDSGRLIFQEPPPIRCCIITTHPNKNLTRCVREPFRPLHQAVAKLCESKSLPFVFRKNLKMPALCAFHYGVILCEPAVTEKEPYWGRDLEKYEKTLVAGPKTDEDFAALGRYINKLCDDEIKMHFPSIRFPFDLNDALNPPNTTKGAEHVAARRLPDRDMSQLRTQEEIDESIEVAEAERQAFMAAFNRLRKTFEANGEDGKTANKISADLPKTLHQFTPPRQPQRSNLRAASPPPPKRESEADEDDKYLEEVIHRAIKYNVLETASADKPNVERNFYRKMLNNSTPNADNSDDNLLRVFDELSDSKEDPRVALEKLPAVTLRKLKRFWNLPNRSTTTSKASLMEGLYEYFDNTPADPDAAILSFTNRVHSEQAERRAEQRRRKLEKMAEREGAKFRRRPQRKAKDDSVYDFDVNDI